jgi:antigen flippase
MASFPSENELSESLSQCEPKASEEHSYNQILRSSAVIGGASVLNIAIGIIRVKAMAVFLGPGGFGLAGLYTSISDLTQSIAGLGVNSSGVRQIAEAAGSGDTERIARTAVVLRRTSLVLGVLGGLLLIVLSKQISIVTFGNSTHTSAICLLSIAVALRLVSAGQGALIQGLRRVADLAKMGVLGAFYGMLVSIPLVYVFREKGIVPSLIAVSTMMFVTSWWYSRKLHSDAPSISVFELSQEVAPLLTLGFAFMSSGLMNMGIAYMVRITVLRRVGFEAAGLYQAAWTLGCLYVGFILQAMGADFYPSLTACVQGRDDVACNRMVNEQARAGLLLGGPGVIATVTFAPFILPLFYTVKFIAAVEILRWICLGTILQVVTWPMSFIIIAKGRRNLYFFSEVVWSAVSLGLAWLCISRFGATGAGMAFFGSCLAHGLIMYPIARRISGFRWSADSARTGVIFLTFIVVVFCVFSMLPLSYATGVVITAVVLSCWYSWRSLLASVTSDLIPLRLRKALVDFGFLSMDS